VDIAGREDGVEGLARAATRSGDLDAAVATTEGSAADRQWRGGRGCCELFAARALDGAKLKN